MAFKPYDPLAQRGWPKTSIRKVPYCNSPVVFTSAKPPPMLEFLQNPHGLLVLNLARTAYWNARLDGVPPHEALDFADAELRAVSGDPDDGLAEWCASGNEPPAELIRRRDAANDDEPRREVA